jgi:hypothetical protein
MLQQCSIKNKGEPMKFLTMTLFMFILYSCNEQDNKSKESPVVSKTKEKKGPVVNPPPIVKPTGKIQTIRGKAQKPVFMSGEYSIETSNGDVYYYKASSDVSHGPQGKFLHKLDVEFEITGKIVNWNGKKYIESTTKNNFGNNPGYITNLDYKVVNDCLQKYLVLDHYIFNTEAKKSSLEVAAMKELLKEEQYITLDDIKGASTYYFSCRRDSKQNPIFKALVRVHYKYPNSGGGFATSPILDRHSFIVEGTMDETFEFRVWNGELDILDSFRGY